MQKTTVSSIKTAILVLCRLLVGAVFVFSGFVKAIDPLGTVYKIQDYLEVMHLQWFNDLAMVASFALFAAEFVCGVLLLLNVRFRWGLWLATLFMVAMTPLTLWIAIADPVTDCGCFGDALVISNWATFWKNVVISLLIVYMWWQRNLQREWLLPVPSAVSAGVVTVLIVAFGVYSVCNIPIVDFRPYKIGANIYEGMQLPEGAKQDVYETTFIYADQNGVEHEFELANVPYNDSTWTFVDQRSELISKGDEPAIHDFSIITPDGDDITEEILFDEGRTYFVVMYDLHKSDVGLLDRVDDVKSRAEREGCRFMVLTASSDYYQQFCEENGRDYPFGFTDPIQLKTIVRANPGVMVLENGVVVDKYNLNTKRRADENKK